MHHHHLIWMGLDWMEWIGRSHIQKKWYEHCISCIIVVSKAALVVGVLMVALNMQLMQLLTQKKTKNKIIKEESTKMIICGTPYNPCPQSGTMTNRNLKMQCTVNKTTQTSSGPLIKRRSTQNKPFNWWSDKKWNGKFVKFLFGGTKYEWSCPPNPCPPLNIQCYSCSCSLSFVRVFLMNLFVVFKVPHVRTHAQ